MGMPVKLSDELVLAARYEAKNADRSITGQIEHWAKLGKAIETMLRVPDIRALKGDLSAPPVQTDAGDLRSRVLEALNQVVSSPDREAVRRRIAASGQPVYESDPQDPQRIIRIAPDGTRTFGRFKGRTFVPETGSKAGK